MPAKLNKTPESQPQELMIAVSGKIISSNFEEFREWAVAQIKGINENLVTDEDFGQATLDVKKLKAFEDTLTEKEEQMLREMDDVYNLIQGTKELKKLSSESRIKLDKLIKSKREQVINDMITVGVTKLTMATPAFRAKIAESVKNKRSLALMNQAIDETVSEINALLAANEEIVTAAETQHGDAVTFGRSQLLVMETETLKVEIERRIERAKADREKKRLQDEADRQRKEAEEAKAKLASANTPTTEPDAAERKQLGAALNQPAPTPAPAAPAPQPEIETLFAGAKREELSQGDEADLFVAILKNALAPVKEARLALKHPENINAAKRFAEKLNAAFEQLIEEVAP